MESGHAGCKFENPSVSDVVIQNRKKVVARSLLKIKLKPYEFDEGHMRKTFGKTLVCDLLYQTSMNANNNSKPISVNTLLSTDL